jgi:putative tryptophan/tyrosine transport system substrate-binding protein
MNNRRKLVVVLGGGALAGPLASFAQQQGKVWRIGILSAGFRGADNLYDEFVAGMRNLGYAEGRNIAIEWRFADGKYERLDQLAAELVALKPDVIVTTGTPPAVALRKATASVPIVVTSVGDPVGNKLAESLSRPGGNLTGLSNLSGDLDGYRLELLISLVPKAMRIAELVNPDNVSGMRRIPGLRAIAQKAGKEFIAVEVRGAGDLDSAFALIAKERAGALMVSSDIFMVELAPQIAPLTLRNRLPSIFGFPVGVEAGGLLSYGPATSELHRRAATYVDKIFKGAKPGDLPIEQPNKFELVVNMKTARALGITIPQSILVRAERVIE